MGDCGIVGYVTNASFLDANSCDGLRKCLADEFSTLYIFHLRGLRGQKTSGERAKKEGGQIFGMGSSAAIAISLLVKNPDSSEHGQIRFHDIGDYLSREDKLSKVAGYASVAGISEWALIKPDAHGDWLRQRDSSYEKFFVMGDKSGEIALFEEYSYGPITHRDAWLYDCSKPRLSSRMRLMLAHYNKERLRYKESGTRLEPVKFVEKDPQMIAWDDKLFRSIASNKELSYSEHYIFKAHYRPFTLQNFYFDRSCIWSAYRMPQIFPTPDAENLVIGTTGRGSGKEFSALISKHLPDLEMISKGQWFPLYLYDEPQRKPRDGLFARDLADDRRRRDAITDAGLAHFQAAYVGEIITKEDLFFYIYGLLHSAAYLERYADNLSKELPRIPRVRTAADFRLFSQAGRDLSALHLNYETVDKYPLTIKTQGKLSDADYRVEKMKLAKKKDPETGKSVNDRSTVIYNNKITLSGIPEAAWDYVVNGKAALDWVMERQAIRVDKASGIVNDANDWAIETMGNPKYPVELFQRVVTVSLETQKIVNALPRLDIREDG